jgi:hypothetical protein
MVILGEDEGAWLRPRDGRHCLASHESRQNHPEQTETANRERANERSACANSSL